MAIKDIRLFGDHVLRTPAAEVVDFDKELRVLVKDLEDTMMDAPGAGLAAPQIGVSLRVFTYWVDDVLGHLVNPVLDLSDEELDGPEGCLSLPGLQYDTTRALSVVAKGQNMWGEPVANLFRLGKYVSGRFWRLFVAAHLFDRSTTQSKMIERISLSSSALMPRNGRAGMLTW